MASPNTKRSEVISSNDLYNTPAEAIYPILPYVDGWITPGSRVLDPCSGNDAITDVIGANYPLANVIGNEPNGYGIPDFEYDFLNLTAAQKADLKSDIIISNPPYNKAIDFILAGFEIAPIQMVLLRTLFLEGGKKYNKLFSLGKLRSVYQFIDRISCTKGPNREPTSNAISYMWYLFDNSWNGSPELIWVKSGRGADNER